MRIQPIEPGTRSELAGIEAGIKAERGRVSLLYQVLLNSPPLAQGWEQLLTAIRNRSSLGVASNPYDFCFQRLGAVAKQWRHEDVGVHQRLWISGGIRFSKRNGHCLPK